MTTAPPVKRDRTQSIAVITPLAASLFGGPNVVASLKDKFVYWGPRGAFTDPRYQIICSPGYDRFATDDAGICWRHVETGEPVDPGDTVNITGRPESQKKGCRSLYAREECHLGKLRHCGREVYYDGEAWRFVLTGFSLTEEEALQICTRDKAKGETE